MRGNDRLSNLLMLGTVILAGLTLAVTVIIGLTPVDSPGSRQTDTILPLATSVPAPDLELGESDVSLNRPLMEGVPFTATIQVHNVGTIGVALVRVVFSIVRPAANGEQNIIVVDALRGPLGPSSSVLVPVTIPPVVPLVPEQYVYHASAYIVQGPEDANLRNNSAPAGVFRIDAPVADCGPGSASLRPEDVVIHQDVIGITVRNTGSKTLYDIPVRVHPLHVATNLDRAYHVARLLPCGGSEVVVAYRQSDVFDVDVGDFQRVAGLGGVQYHVHVDASSAR